MVRALSSSHIQKSPRVVYLYFLIGRFTTTIPEIKFHFVSPAMTSNVNRFFFMAERNSISGIISFRISRKHPLRREAFISTAIYIVTVVYKGP